MTTPTPTIADFILARVAEDEAAARAATGGPWRYNPTKVNSVDREESVFAGHYGIEATTVASTGPEDDRQSMADAAHIARHDPARVLAECAAKRAIVASHESWPALIEGPPTFERVDSADPSSFAMRASQHIQWLTQQEYRAKFGDEPLAAPMLYHLAAIHSDHPDFNPEWRP